MANATYVANTAGTLTATSADDIVTVDRDIADTNTYVISAGGGTDTVIFDAVLGTDGDGIDSYFANGLNGFRFDNAAGTDQEDFDLSAVESIQFLNGTITSNASVTPETLMSGAINQDITALAGTATFATDTLLTWDGTSVTPDAGWTIQSVNGQSSSANALITVLDGTTVQGRVQVNGTNNGISVQAENSFHTALDIGEEGTISVDLVLTDGTDTFSQTVTVDVVGVPSDADNTFIDDDTAAGIATTPFDLLGGDDYAVGNGGADIINGGDGNDTIYAGATDDGADLLIGGDGDDVLAGGTGNDTLIGDDHNDGTIVGDETVVADEGANQLFGGEGDDLIAIGGYDAGVAITTAATIADANGATGGEAFGGNGDDFILGTATGDDLVGLGDGNDTVVLGDGDSTVYAGAGDTGVDDVTAGDGDNTIYVGAGNDVITSVGNGDNTIGLGAGNDTATTIGTGDNMVFGGAGDDTITGGTGDDTIFGGDDDDTLNTGNGNNVADGGAGDDTITGGTGNDVITGGAGDDTITVVAGGNNTVTGGAGDDTLTAGGGTDTFVFAEGDGDDTIATFAVNVDEIDFTALGVSSLSDLVTEETGGSTTIFFGDGDSVTLTGVALATLDNDDFLF